MVIVDGRMNGLMNAGWLMAMDSLLMIIVKWSIKLAARKALNA